MSKTKISPRYIAKKIPIKKLGLGKDYLPKSILEVTKKLSQAGFDAYIVGGGVRDALLGMEPKDFDAVTNATPSEIKSVFGKRCRIIGRRFQLAHVYSGEDLIEVATFRAPPRAQGVKSHSGMLMRDNVWGTIEEDYERRDFTINALYFDPHKGYVMDFCNAVDDIQNRRLRFLGDAQTRIEEDPVRLLRAIRFAAKLNLDIDQSIIEGFNKHNWLHLQQVSPHRLYDESLKIFGGGYVAKALPLLEKYKATNFLFAHKFDGITPLLQKVADNTDSRVSDNKSVNPAFFYAAILWPEYLRKYAKLNERLPMVEAMNKAAIKVINEQRKITAMPKFAEYFIRDIWSLQPRLISPKPKQVSAIVGLAKFRAAFDFLLLRELTGDANTVGMGSWWEDFQTFDDAGKVQAIKALQRRQIKSNSSTMAIEATPTGSSNPKNIMIPKPKNALPKRRRRKAAPVQDVQIADVGQQEHMLAHTIRGEKPATHD